jgi:integrase
MTSGRQGETSDNHQYATSQVGARMATSPAPRDHLDEELDRLLEASVAPSTKRAYDRAWKHFAEWCTNGDVDPDQATDRDFARYVTFLIGCQARLSTIKQARAAVKGRCTEKRRSSPTDGPLSRAAVRAAGRSIGAGVTKARAITPDELGRLVAAVAGRPSELRDRAMILVWFSAALRRSELVALDRSDITSSSRGLVVHIARSKTDQEAIGADVPIARQRPPLCAAHAWDEWARTLPLGSPAFPPITRSGRILTRRMNPGSMSEYLDRIAKLAEVDLDRLSPHSMRAGMITALALEGHTETSIAGISRHESLDVLRGYVRPAQVWDNPALQTRAFTPPS